MGYIYTTFDEFKKHFGRIEDILVWMHDDIKKGPALGGHLQKYLNEKGPDYVESMIKELEHIKLTVIPSAQRKLQDAKKVAKDAKEDA